MRQDLWLPAASGADRGRRVFFSDREGAIASSVVSSAELLEEWLANAASTAGCEEATACVVELLGWESDKVGDTEDWPELDVVAVEGCRLAGCNAAMAGAADAMPAVGRVLATKIS